MSISFNAFYYTSTSFKFAKLLSRATHELTPQHYTSWPGSHVMPCHVTSCQVVFRHDTLYMSQHVRACSSMSQHVTACHSMSQHVTACHSMSQHVTACHSGHVMLCHVMSWQGSFQAIPYHVILHRLMPPSQVSAANIRADLITANVHACAPHAP